MSASKSYFDKELSELTLAEAALIAGLPQAPSIYSPFNNAEAALKRRDQVLYRMYKEKYISKAQYNDAKAEELKLSTKPPLYSYNKAPYFVDFVLKEMDKLGFEEQEISQGGLKIYTTLDLKAQDVAQESITKNLEGYGLKSDVTQMSLFSFSPTTGRIYTYVGGKNYEKSQYDRISDAVRPPGSAFKPFVYTAALQKGYGLNDIIEDSPLDLNGWKPRNYGNKYSDKLPLWKALAISSNVAAVRLIKLTTASSVINLAKEMGISTNLQNDLTIGLGSNGVKLFDMAVAYGAFANGGFRVRPYSVERVENSRGVVIYENAGPKIVKVISFDTAAGMTYMLRKVVEIGTGRAAFISNAAAGKTGTTDDYHDAWFVGFTPDVVCGVWLGNDDNSRLPGITGGGLPAKTWADYMREITKNFPDSVFDYPEFELSDIKKGEEIKANEEKEKLEEGEDDIIIEGFDEDFDQSLNEGASTDGQSVMSEKEFLKQVIQQAPIPQKIEAQKPVSTSPFQDVKNKNDVLIPSNEPEEMENLAPLPMAN